MLKSIWRTIKPYITGAIVGFLALLGIRKLTRGFGDGGRRVPQRMSEAVGDNDERTRNIDGAAESVEKLEQDAKRADNQRDDLEQRTDRVTETGRETVRDNRDFIERARNRGEK